MPSWGFRQEKFQGAQGANTVGGLKAGYQPFYQAGNLKSKRNVIATSKGWIRRQIKKTDGVTRIVDEVIVAAAPGTSSYPGAAYLGFPDIAQMYLANSTFGPLVTQDAIANNTALKLCVVFNEPVKHSGLAGRLRIAIANTAGGNNSLVCYANSVNSNTGIINANNTLVFAFAAAPTGTYKVAAQTVANATSTAANLVSLNTGSESANLVITGAVSNTLSTFTIV